MAASRPASAQALGSAPVLFQALQYFYDSNGFGVGGISILRPLRSAGDSANFFCNLDINDPDACRPFNIASCFEPPRPIRFTVLHPPTSGASINTSSIPPTGPKFFMWLQPNNNTCAYSPLANTDPVSIGPNSGESLQLTANYVMFGANYPVPMTLPDALTDTPALDTGVIRSLFPGLCQGVVDPSTPLAPGANATPGLAANPNGGSQVGKGPTNFEIFTLCFGVDGDNNSILNETGGSSGSSTTTNNTPGQTTTTGNSSGGGDVVGYVNFFVDTIPPPAVQSFTTKSLVRRVNLDIAAGSDKGEAWGVEIRSTDDPANFSVYDPNAVLTGNVAATNTAKPCDQWNSNYARSLTRTDSGSLTASQDIAGDGLLPSAFCVRNLDYVGNVGPWSVPKVDAPHNECDLFGCYPDHLRLALCGAALGQPPALLALVALGAWRWRRARRRNAP